MTSLMETKTNLESQEAKILDYVASNYWIKEFLGKGGFCYVLRVADKKTETEHALKFMNDLAYNCYPSLLQEEAVRLERSQHPNVVEFHDFIDGKILLMEYLPDKSIDDLLLQGTEFKPDSITAVRNQIMAALLHGHRQNVIHHDVTAANILLGRKIKLIDYGMTEGLVQKGLNQGYLSGTPGYLAPEILLQNLPVSEEVQYQPVPESDFYGLGIVLFRMLTGMPLPEGMEALTAGWFAKRMNLVSAPDELKSSIQKLVSWQPEQRTSWLDKSVEKLAESVEKQV